MSDLEYITSDADNGQWALSGVALFLVIHKSLVQASHGEEDLPEEA